jgi:hypothetical protein
MGYLKISTAHKLANIYLDSIDCLMEEHWVENEITPIFHDTGDVGDADLFMNQGDVGFEDRRDNEALDRALNGDD